jgi:two-component system KDP operon response regulator KdpE
MMGRRVLIIEDEPSIVRVLESLLASTGALVAVAWSGSQGLEYISRDQYDIVVCDLGLPDLDGFDVVRSIRERSDVPIVVLSARDGEEDRIAALDFGSDDFIAKPFLAGELLARLRAAMRRRACRSVSDAIKLDGLELDLSRRRVVLEGEEIRLSTREHALMLVLARTPGAIVTHEQIKKAVWGSEATVDTQFVRVLVGQLRQKVEEDPSRPRLIKTEPGLGYRLNL